MPDNNKRLIHFGYTHDETEKNVRELFAQRFGFQPVAVFRNTNGDWWAGPVVVDEPEKTQVYGLEAQR